MKNSEKEAFLLEKLNSMNQLARKAINTQAIKKSHPLIPANRLSMIQMRINLLNSIMDRITFSTPFLFKESMDNRFERGLEWLSERFNRILQNEVTETTDDDPECKNLQQIIELVMKVVMNEIK